MEKNQSGKVPSELSDEEFVKIYCGVIECGRDTRGLIERSGLSESSVYRRLNKLAPPRPLARVSNLAQ